MPTTKVVWSKIRYFVPSEFDSPDQPGSGELCMDETLVEALDRARAFAGIPFKITSGYRTPAHNAMVGGRILSAHMQGKAADIAARTPATRWKVLTALLAAGFQRVEICPFHIHVDVAHGDTYPQQVVLFEQQKGVIV